MRMWLLNLPDILVFFSIWWSGFFPCFTLMILGILVSVWSGGTITFGCNTKGTEDVEQNF